MLHVNDTAPKISTTDIFNTPVNLENYRGKKVLITFFRFSLCPFCNLQLHTLIKEYNEMGIEMIAFFGMIKGVLTRPLEMMIMKSNI